MKNVLVNSEGELLCPHCGVKQQFSYRRTAKGKLAVGVTAGLVGALALPKRLQCLGCHEYLKAPAVPVDLREDMAVTLDRRPSSGGEALELPAGPVQVFVTGCEWDGAARLSMLKAARPGLRDHAYERITGQLRTGEPAPVASLTVEGAAELARRLIDNGFTVDVLEPEPT